MLTQNWTIWSPKSDSVGPDTTGGGLRGGVITVTSDNEEPPAVAPVTTAKSTFEHTTVWAKTPASPATLARVVAHPTAACKLPDTLQAVYAERTSGSKLFVNTAVGKFEVSVPPLRQCEHTLVELRPSGGSLVLNAATAAKYDLDAAPVQASLVIFTNFNADRTAFVAKIFPDPAAEHYMVAIQVCMSVAKREGGGWLLC